MTADHVFSCPQAFTTGLELGDHLRTLLKRDYEHRWGAPTSVYDPFMATEELRAKLPPTSIRDLALTAFREVGDAIDSHVLSGSQLDAMRTYPPRDVATLSEVRRSTLELIDAISPAFLQEIVGVVSEVVIVSDASFPVIQQMERKHKEKKGLAEYVSPHDLYDTFISASNSDTFGRIYLGTSTADDPVMTSIKLCHELGHHLFHSILCCDKVFQVPRDTMFLSPARKRLRIAADTFHALFAIEREIYAARRLLELTAAPRYTFLKERRQELDVLVAENSASMRDSIGSIPADALTAVGQSLFLDIASTLQ